MRWRAYIQLLEREELDDGGVDQLIGVDEFLHIFWRLLLQDRFDLLIPNSNLDEHLDELLARGLRHSRLSQFAWGDFGGILGGVRLYTK